MITATLIGGSTPPDVQIVVSAAPNGIAWTLTGSAAGTSWTVPGGEGIGDGGQIVRVDNRTPGNVPVTYTFTAGATVETSNAVTVAIGRDGVLQSLDGSASVTIELQRPSLDTQLELNVSRFSIPGRVLPVFRHSITSAGGGSFVIRAYDPDDFAAVVGPGGPIVFRAAAQPFDLPRVMVIQPMGLSSRADHINGYREWQMPFLFAPDPYLDVVLGGFAWDEFDAAWAGKAWTSGFDTRMAGVTWNAFDTFDWSLL